MSERPTDADLARIERAIAKWHETSGYDDRTCEDVSALVAEVRRLHQVIEITALSCEDHGLERLARAIREAEREHVLRPEKEVPDA